MKNLAWHNKRCNVPQRMEQVVAEEENNLLNTYILSWSITFHLQRTRNEQTNFVLFWQSVMQKYIKLQNKKLNKTTLA